MLAFYIGLFVCHNYRGDLAVPDSPDIWTIASSFEHLIARKLHELDLSYFWNNTFIIIILNWTIHFGYIIGLLSSCKVILSFLSVYVF